MKLLMDLGVAQAVLPPQERPDLSMLRRIGFAGSDADVLQAAQRADPVLLAACWSASSMWAANAATVSASADAADGRVHFTPANLISQFHRSQEAATTSAILRAVFADEGRFAHHPALPAASAFSDEGAANHTRLTRTHGSPGVELFVYGRSALDASRAAPARYPARQTLEAASAVARLHQLDAGRTVFAQQSPAAIDAGVFHNDVIALGNENVLLYHEEAFVDAPAVIAELSAKVAQTGGTLIAIEAKAEELPLADAVRSYVFNSQLVTLSSGEMAMIAPAECQEVETARRFIIRTTAHENPVTRAHFADVGQSMNNGGGPACLRLRIVLTPAERAAAKGSVFLTEPLHASLTRWIERHYREQLSPADLVDPKLVDESRAALDELTQLLRLGTIYSFQR
jgi:succinylarginine dihydrolase